MGPAGCGPRFERMKSTLLAAAWLMPTAVLQSTLIPRSWPLDLFLLLAVLNGLRRSPVRASAEGMAIGLVQDIAGGGILGLNATCKAVAAAVAAWPQRAFSAHIVVMGALLMFAATLIERCIKVLLLAILGLTVSGWTAPLVWLPLLHAAMALLLLSAGVLVARRRRRSAALMTP